MKKNMADCRGRSSERCFLASSFLPRVLNSGKNYDSLKNVIIVMITPFDPFGMGRMVYTIKNHCVEVPKMPYEDGASTLFLYTKGTVGVPSEAVMQLLRYMENTIYENAANDDLRKLHEMVEIIRKDPEVNGMWMSITEDDIKQQLMEDRDRANEERDRANEERDKATEERDRVTEERDRAIENFMRATEKIAWYEKIMAEMKEKNK